MMAAASLLMPADMIDILKRINLFTGKRLLDTPGMLVDLVTCVSEFILKCVKMIPNVPECIVRIFENMFGFGKKKQTLDAMNAIVWLWNKNKRVMESVTWRESVRNMQETLKRDSILLDYFRKDAVGEGAYNDFKRVVRSMVAYESCTRKEPACLVFEGPPGTMKSIDMSKVAKMTKKSVYTHAVKPLEAGKDFYDSYNNEELFVIDDLGQMGLSCWRIIINFVSIIKCPLDCAAADLKDTKFFDSEMILITTNNLRNMTGLSKSDCISHVEALWRRCHVLDYSNVDRVDGNRRGDVVYRRYDLHEKKFVENFDVPSMKHLPTRCSTADSNRLIAWETYIANALSEHYQNVYGGAQLTHSDEVDIDRIMEEYSFCDAQGQSLDVIGYALNLFLYYIETSFRELKTIVMDNPKTSALIAIATSALILVYYTYTGFAKEEISTAKSIVDEWRKGIETSFRTNKRLNMSIGESTIVETPIGVPTLATAVKDRMVLVEFLCDKPGNVGSKLCQALTSGHHLLVVGHSYHDTMKILNVYRTWEDYENQVIMYNNIPYEQTYTNQAKDISILTLPKTMVSPFKKSTQFFKIEDVGKVAVYPYFVNAGCIGRLGTSFTIGRTQAEYVTVRGRHTLPAEGYANYPLSAPGFCGSLIVDSVLGVIGIHVAGNGAVGHAILIGDIVKDIRKVFENDGNLADLTIKQVYGTDFSGSMYETDMFHAPPKKSSIIPSPLSGYDVPTKFPANMQAKGHRTLEEMARKSFKPIPVIPQVEVDFAMNCLRDFMVPFSDLTEEQIVRGDDVLPPLNKDSVNGYGLDEDKEKYIDFDNGQLTEYMRELMKRLEDDVLNDRIDYKDHLYYETLKDETRPQHKVDKPRAFRISQLTSVVLLKKCLGNLFKHIVTTRDFNQIMIGMNPYSEWNDLYEEMAAEECTGDGDIGQYDGRQAAQIQDGVNELVKSFYVGNHPELLAAILEAVVRSWVLVSRKLMLTTHSMPSGSWVTALFNSLYNRAYTACTYYRESTKHGDTPRKEEFHKIKDKVLGDDKLFGSSGMSAKYVNALTLKSFFNSIGMEFTDGDKGEILSAHKPLKELVFLKRGFRYHNELGKVVGPLAVDTLRNTILWVNGRKDTRIVMEGKLHAYQREMYLHGDAGEECVNKLCKYMDRIGYKYVRLPKSYMYSLFTESPDYAYELYKRDFDKNF
jgi:hypothetical protein